MTRALTEDRRRAVTEAERPYGTDHHRYGLVLAAMLPCNRKPTAKPIIVVTAMFYVNIAVSATARLALEAHAQAAR